MRSLSSLLLFSSLSLSGVALGANPRIDALTAELEAAASDGHISYAEAKRIHVLAGANPSVETAAAVDAAWFLATGEDASPLLASIVQSAFSRFFDDAHVAWWASPSTATLEVDVSEIPEAFRLRAEAASAIPTDIRWLKFENGGEALGYGASFDDDSDARTLIAISVGGIEIPTSAIVYE